MRYIGVKNNRIFFVSENPIKSKEFNILSVPEELNHLSSKELILNCRFKNNNIYYKFANKFAKDMKIALVGNYGTACGIATYAENLWSEIIKHVDDYHLFIEDDLILNKDLNISKDKISICWKRGESLKQLSKEIKDYNPDIVLIQHEFGLWPNAGYWLSLMSQLSDYRVIVTMHSVFHHKDKTICEAAMPEIVTHLHGGRDVLVNEKQVPGQVYVIPHGCFPSDNKEKLWNFYKSDRTFMQFGFGFRYKNFENSIKAAAILKNKYSDVFFTALFSESEHAKIEHQIYYNELMDLIESLDLQDNVAIIRGYQSNSILDSYLRTNQATVFPYGSHPEHEVFGASGAARVSMSKGIPVITSSVNHFSDLPSIKADSPQEIADALELLFNNNEEKEKQLFKQLEYLQKNSWENVAMQYISLFENNFIL